MRVSATPAKTSVELVADICAILPMMAIKIRGHYSQFILFMGPALSTRG